MKKIIAFFLVLALMLCCALIAAFGEKASAEYSVVINDEAKLLKDDDENKVLEAMRQVQPYANVGFMTYPSGGSTQNSAKKVQEWGEQTFGTDSGFVAFIIDMTNRHLDIYASHHYAGILTPGIENSIADKVYMKATLGKYADCAVETFGLIRDALVKGGVSKDEFVFRGKIKWGMSEKEVKALEDEYALILQSNVFSGIGYTDIPISNYKGDLVYIFFRERLALSNYNISDADEGTFEYLRKALKAVYGDEAEADRTELNAYLNKIREDKLSEDSLKDCLLAKWMTSDGTVIYLIRDLDEKVCIMYFSPDYMNLASEEEVNVTGL